MLSSQHGAARQTEAGCYVASGVYSQWLLKFDKKKVKSSLFNCKILSTKYV